MRGDLCSVSLGILLKMSIRGEGKSMPTWWQGHNIIHFAARKKHIGLYPGPEAVVSLAEKLDAYGFKYRKGSIQIPCTKILPLDLISAIAAWCRDTGNHA